MKLSRRKLIGGAALGVAGAALLGRPQLFGIRRSRSRELRIGYITALSGVRANFGEADAWTLERIRAALRGGLVIQGERYAVDIVVKDNQSDQNRSSAVSSDLLLRDKVDLLLIQDGDAVYPAGPLCDVNAVPAISTMMPWQAFLYGRGSDPQRGFPYTFHFFWGNDDVIRNFVGMWESIATNRRVGTFYFDNPPGRSYADPERGMPAGMKRAGYKELDAGLFKISTDDFSNQVSLFKNGGAQIVSGFAFANHFATFWNQAQQAAFRPEICTVAAAFLFPSAIESLGPAGDGMSTEVWWTPRFPFHSSITGQSASALATEWEQSTGRQWTPPLGYGHALWEVGIAALRNAADPKDNRAVRDAIARLADGHDRRSGQLQGQRHTNVATTGVVGGQWRKARAGRHPFELQIIAQRHRAAHPAGCRAGAAVPAGLTAAAAPASRL